MDSMKNVQREFMEYISNIGNSTKHEKMFNIIFAEFLASVGKNSNIGTLKEKYFTEQNDQLSLKNLYNIYFFVYPLFLFTTGSIVIMQLFDVAGYYVNGMEKYVDHVRLNTGNIILRPIIPIIPSPIIPSPTEAMPNLLDIVTNTGIGMAFSNILFVELYTGVERIQDNDNLLNLSIITEHITKIKGLISYNGNLIIATFIESCNSEFHPGFTGDIAPKDDDGKYTYLGNKINELNNVVVGIESSLTRLKIVTTPVELIELVIEILKMYIDLNKKILNIYINTYKGEADRNKFVVSGSFSTPLWGKKASDAINERLRFEIAATKMKHHNVAVAKGNNGAVAEGNNGVVAEGRVGKGNNGAVAEGRVGKGNNGGGHLGGSLDDVDDLLLAGASGIVTLFFNYLSRNDTLLESLGNYGLRSRIDDKDLELNIYKLQYIKAQYITLVNTCEYVKYCIKNYEEISCGKTNKNSLVTLCGDNGLIMLKRTPDQPDPSEFDEILKLRDLDKSAFVISIIEPDADVAKKFKKLGMYVPLLNTLKRMIESIHKMISTQIMKPSGRAHKSKGVKVIFVLGQQFLEEVGKEAGKEAGDEGDEGDEGDNDETKQNVAQEISRDFSILYHIITDIFLKFEQVKIDDFIEVIKEYHLNRFNTETKSLGIFISEEEECDKINTIIQEILLEQQNLYDNYNKIYNFLTTGSSILLHDIIQCIHKMLSAYINVICLLLLGVVYWNNNPDACKELIHKLAEGDYNKDVMKVSFNESISKGKSSPLP